MNVEFENGAVDTTPLTGNTSSVPSPKEVGDQSTNRVLFDTTSASLLPPQEVVARAAAATADLDAMMADMPGQSKDMPGQSKQSKEICDELMFDQGYDSDGNGPPTNTVRSEFEADYMKHTFPAGESAPGERAPVENMTATETTRPSNLSKLR